MLATMLREAVGREGNPILLGGKMTAPWPHGEETSIPAQSA